MRFLFALITLAISGLLVPAHAQPSGAMGENFIYLVEPGDTLSDLSELYATRAAQWRQIQGLNEVNNEFELAIGKALKIPFSMIPVIATEAAISHLKGEVWVNDSRVEKVQSLKTGDTIRTGETGFVTLQLEDKSTLTLPNNSQLYIKQLNAFERTQLTDAILELQAGSIESRVAPEKTGVGRFEIHTPMSITGVRGTDLRIHATNDTSRTELITGKAHLNTTQTSYQDLRQAQGASVRADGSYTISPLLPAPIATEPVRGGQGWQTTISPVAQAQHYVVQIALEPTGASLVQKFKIESNNSNNLTISLPSSSPALHYAFIRAVDENGLMGIDVTVSFLGQRVLVSSDGSAVVSSDGQAILLGHD